MDLNKMDVNEKGLNGRVASQNIASSVQFVLRGAQKRRSLAYGKARNLQRELGVIPRLVGIKN